MSWTYSVLKTLLLDGHSMPCTQAVPFIQIWAGKKGKKIDKESLFKILNKCEHVKLTYLTSKSGNALNKKQSYKSGMSDLASKLVLKGPLLVSDPYSVWCLDSWAAHKTGYQRFTKLITYIWAKDTETHNSVIIEYSWDPITGLM